MFIEASLSRTTIGSHYILSYQILAWKFFRPSPNKEAWKGIFPIKKFQHHIHK